MKKLLVYLVGPATSLQIQNLFQVLNLFLELLDVGIVSRAHLVGLNLDQDLLGSVCKLKGRYSFLNVVNHRGDRGNQGGLGITAERVLQKPGNFGVSVGDMSRFLSLGKALNHFA
jgi:hypothetical protein